MKILKFTDLAVQCIIWLMIVLNVHHYGESAAFLLLLALWQLIGGLAQLVTPTPPVKPRLLHMGLSINYMVVISKVGLSTMTIPVILGIAYTIITAWGMFYRPADKKGFLKHISF